MPDFESTQNEPKIYDVRTRGQGCACEIDYETNRLTLANDGKSDDLLVVALEGVPGRIPTIDELPPITIRAVKKTFAQFRETA